MSAADIARDIRILGGRIGRILAPDSAQVLEHVSAQLEACQITSRRRPRKNEELPLWEFKISSQRSLKFRPSWDEPKLQPDIFCRLIGPGEAGWPLQRQQFVLRVWSLNDRLSYRPEFNADSIGNWLRAQGKPDRVLFRFHFDRADLGAKGTVFHFQVGGKPVEEERELCWFEGLPSLPRIPTPPLDLVLACELVVANFFHDYFQELCRDHEWCALVRRAEQRTLRKYYEICNTCVCYPSDYTLLKKLWNV